MVPPWFWRQTYPFRGFSLEPRDLVLIDVDDPLAVERHLDPRSDAFDVDAVPLPRRLDRILRGAT